MFLHPVIIYGRHERQRHFIHISDRKFKRLAYILIGLQLFTILFFASYVFMLLARGDLSQVRSELITGTENMGASLSRTIAGTASFYYCINIVLFFYSLAFRKDSKWLLILLIGTSVSRIFHSLTYMGRDGLLFWILSFYTTYLIFKPNIKDDAKKAVRKAFYVCGGFALILIVLISLSRFGESDKGTFYSLVSYFGQPINNFGLLFHTDVALSGTKSMFPLLYGEKGITGAEAIENADIFESMYGFKSNIFFSFIGNMITAWGRVITFIIVFLYCVIFSNRLNRARVSLGDIIVLMVVTQIAIHNYFYWAYYIRVANLFLITMPLFVYYLKRGKVID